MRPLFPQGEMAFEFKSVFKIPYISAVISHINLILHMLFSHHPNIHFVVPPLFSPCPKVKKFALTSDLLESLYDLYTFNVVSRSCEPYATAG